MMNTTLQIHLTDRDFLDYNIFMGTRSSYGRRSRRRNRIMLSVAFTAAAVLCFLLNGVSSYSVTYAVWMAIAGGLLIWKLDSIFGWLAGMIVRSMKKDNKLAYSPDAQVELCEEYLAEITAVSRSQWQWDTVERISLVGGRVWYLHLNASAAMILPVEQIKAQTDIGELFRFLEGKCKQIDRYE